MNGDGKLTQAEAVERSHRIQEYDDARIGIKRPKPPSGVNPDIAILMMFSDWDANRDKLVTFDEYLEHFRAQSAKSFSRMDANADGKVLPAELRQYQERMGMSVNSVESTITSFDTDKDGAISAEEWGPR